MHEMETVDTRTIINEMMPKFYDYIVAEKLAENPYIVPPDVTTANCSLYVNEETMGESRTASRGGYILRERIEL